MYGNLNLKLRDLNEHLVCVLCKGYYVDATTIIECLHSFCRSCIVTHLATKNCCPKCEIPAHKTRPLLNIRSDKTLQDVVYKLVPELFEKERERKLKFHKDTGIPLDVEEEKDVSPNVSPRKVENRVSLSIESDNRNLVLSDDSQWIKEAIQFPKRYLRCFDEVTVGTINKLMMQKLAREDLEVITFCRGEVLPEKYTLMDVSNTFSWKSDRPLSLTYMTFSSKKRKRKMQENIENTIVDDVQKTPTKKRKKEIALSSTNSDPGINTKIPDVVPKTVIPAFQPQQPDINTTKTHFSTSNIKYAVSKSKPSMMPSTKSQTTSQNGGKNLSYSVMNVPLSQAVTAPYPEPATVKASLKSQVKLHSPPTNGSQRREGVNDIAARNFQSPTSHGPERTKSINSIANRLQIQRQMQHERTEPEKKNEFQPKEVFRNTSQSSSNVFIQSSPTRPSSETVAAMRRQRNQFSQKVNAASLQNLPAVQYARTTMRPGAPVVQKSAPNLGAVSQRNVANFLATSANASGTKFIQLKHSKDLPNYAQATERQRHMQMLQRNSRPKYQEIKPKISHHMPISRGHRTSSSEEDMNLLSTTRQLASLRQQQKILNEIAAAVAGRSNPQTRMTSPRLPLPSQPGTSKVTSPHYGMSFSSTRPRLSVVSPPNSSPQASNLVRSNGTAIRPYKQNGGSFSEVTRPSTISYSSLNSSLGGNIDLYHQNTIAKAKDALREMDIRKNRQPTYRAQVRPSLAPYVPPRPTAPRKMQPKTSIGRPASYAPIAPKPSPPVPFSKVSRPPNYNRPPILAPKTFSPVSSPYTPARHTFRPSLPQQQVPKSTETTLSPAITQPEQDQPLCLVVKK